MKKILVWLGILLLASGAVLFLVKDVQDSSLEDFVLSGIDSITSDSFSIEGLFVLENPSYIGIPIRNVEYDLILEKNGEIISTGNLPPFILTRGITETEFTQQINWVPTGAMLVDLVLENEVYVTIKGNISLNIPFISSKKIPFEDRTNIKEYISYLDSNEVVSTDQVIGNVNDTSVPVIDGVVNTNNDSNEVNNSTSSSPIDVINGLI